MSGSSRARVRRGSGNSISCRRGGGGGGRAGGGGRLPPGAGAAAMKASVDAGPAVTLDKTETIADGLMPVRPGDLTFAHVQKYVDRIVTVSDPQIVDAVLWLFSKAKIVAGPSGAATGG